MTSEQGRLSLPNWTPRQVAGATLVVLGVIVAFLLVVQLQAVIFSLFVAIVISTAIAPLVDGLHARGVPRWSGVVIVYACMLLAFGLVVWLIVPVVAEQGAAIATTSGQFYVGLLNTLRLSPSRLIRRLALQLPAGVTPEPTPAETPEEMLQAVQQAAMVAGDVIEGIFVFLAVFLLAFFWTLERERIVRSLLLLVPQPNRESTRELYQETEIKVGGYVRGVVILAVIVGAMALVAYLLIGLPYALLLAIIAGLFEVIPIIGPPLGILPAVLVALAFDPSKVYLVLIAYVIIQSTENALLVPRIMGRTVGVSPVVSLLALAAFGTLFGVAGALLAIPLAAVIQLLLDRYVLGPTAVEPDAPDGRSGLSVLRYEAQQLVSDVRNRFRDNPREMNDEADRVEDEIEALAADLDSLLAQSENGEEANP
jgi:predicted PurR-regulated permease PerM